LIHPEKSRKLGKVEEIEIDHGKMREVRRKYEKDWNFELCSQFP